MSTFDQRPSALEEMDDPTDRDDELVAAQLRGDDDASDPGPAGGDLSSGRPDGSGEGGSATTTGDSDGGPGGAATHEDLDRGNADGSTPSTGPREDALAQARKRADAEPSSEADGHVEDSGRHE